MPRPASQLLWTVRLQRFFESHPVLRNILRFSGIALPSALLLCLLGWVMRPDLTEHVAPPDPEDLAQVKALRHHGIDPQNPQVLYVEVDYAQGPRAPWYPKNESPLLTDLVNEGKLPPVAERVGPEPLVYRGVDGIGQYGGTWIAAEGGLWNLGARKTACTLVRWSPNGYPIVPHIAKKWEVDDEYKVYTFYLRKGMRWSDGHPFTADDIMYWWEKEANHPLLNAKTKSEAMSVRGQLGRIEKVDDHCIRFIFPESHGLFLPMLATFKGIAIAGSPKHYLERFHPDPQIGDAELVKKMLAAQKMKVPADLYASIVKDVSNPEHPRLWPWLYRTYKSDAPYSLVRNPYFWMVDEVGNQLPYVDQLFWEHVNPDLLNASIATGRFTTALVKPKEYTLVMSGREKGDYRVYRWFRADCSDAMIHVNLNRKILDRESEWKHKLLNDVRFRRALSVAIQREQIIEASYYGETEAAQCAPGPNSYFYHPQAYSHHTQFDLELANRLLDECGLTTRDSEGFRSAPDGTRLTFFLNHADWLNPVTAQFIAEDWMQAGIRTITRVRASSLFYTEKSALVHDFTIFTGENEFVPILEPRVFLPISAESNFALGYANWYLKGGLYQEVLAGENTIPVPKEHPLYKGLLLFEQLKGLGNLAEQKKLFDRILDLSAEHVWTIGICTSPMYLCVVKNGFKNIPRHSAQTFTFLGPGCTGQETAYFENAQHTPELAAALKREITTITPPPESLQVQDAQPDFGKWVAWILKYTFLGIALLLTILLCLKHPFVLRRLLVMIPTLLAISIIVFTIIQLPPGDFLTAKIMELQMKGEQADEQELQNLREMFHLDDPMPLRYARWLGLGWFFSFESKDEGLLQGNLGRSMETKREVNRMVGDRILLTVLISFGTILFTWVTAIPIGIYSAVRQYSVGDYVLTFIGFIGMCVPSFLLALILMYLSHEYLHLPVDRLFSTKYALQPYWDLAKVIDLLKHIWVPIFILGVGGTAGMIRVMRGNLLDELKKPYVTTARAKGVRPLKLLLKYPVRLALNPFISGIGGIFPALISGGALVSVVLSLPTVGPLMLQALMNQDTALAGSMLMVLSSLGVFGVLVSDLLLLWVDPRIRFQGGTR